MRMPTNSEFTSLQFTVAELVGILYPGVPFSETLPPAWAGLLRTYNVGPDLPIVWGYAAYPKGKPVALTVESKLALESVYAGEKRRFR
jgi:hypothetical protein